MIRSFTLGLALVACVAFAGSASAQDTPAVAAGKKFLADQEKTITKVMHPTAKLMSVDPLKVEETSSGFTLTATYNFKGSVKELFFSQMTFSFDANGRFGGVTTRATNSYVKPFTAANAGLAVMRELAAKEMEVRKDSLLKSALTAVNAQVALDVFLKAKQPAN